MKYRIEIWQPFVVIDTYESNDAQACRYWLDKNGYEKMSYDGECSIAVYIDGRMLDVYASVLWRMRRNKNEKKNH